MGYGYYKEKLISIDMNTQYREKIIPEENYNYMFNFYQSGMLKLTADMVKIICSYLDLFSKEGQKVLLPEGDELEFSSLLSAEDYPLFYNAGIDSIFLKLVSNSERRIVSACVFVNDVKISEPRRIQKLRSIIVKIKTLCNFYSKLFKQYKSYNDYLLDAIKDKITEIRINGIEELMPEEIYKNILRIFPTEELQLERLKKYVNYAWGETYNLHGEYDRCICYFYFFHIKLTYSKYNMYLADAVMKQLLWDDN